MKTARGVARLIAQLEDEIQHDESTLARKRESLEDLRAVAARLEAMPARRRRAAEESGPAAAVVPWSIPHRLLEALAEAQAPRTAKQLQAEARASAHHVSQAVAGLLKTGRIRKVGDGRWTTYTLPDRAVPRRRRKGAK